MSRANVEVVQAALEAWQRDDFEALLSKTHPDIEWHAVLQRLVEGAGSVYRGHEGLRRLWDAYRNEVEGFQVEADELRDAGKDRVVLLGRIRWRGVASGIEIESPFGMGDSRPRGEDVPLGGLPQPGGNPRSRRAGGVGDV
jgi:hypothetical protein